MIFFHLLGYALIAWIAFNIGLNTNNTRKSGSEYHYPKTLRNWYVSYVNLSIVGWMILLLGFVLVNL